MKRTPNHSSGSSELLSTFHSTKSHLKPLSTSRSFEDSVRSTLPSSLHSTRSSVKHLLSTRKLATSLCADLKPVQTELRDLATLQSLLLQWHYVNAVAERTEVRFSQKIEEQVYDRGTQVSALQEKVLTAWSKKKDKEQTQILADELSSEISALTPCESDIETAAEYLQEMQTVTARSLTRLPQEGDANALLEALRSAGHSLARIYQEVENEGTETNELSKSVQHLSEVVAEEREETCKAFLMLNELRKLYGEEKEAIDECARSHFI